MTKNLEAYVRCLKSVDSALRCVIQDSPSYLKAASDILTSNDDLLNQENFDEQEVVSHLENTAEFLQKISAQRLSNNLTPDLNDNDYLTLPSF